MLLLLQTPRYKTGLQLSGAALVGAVAMMLFARPVIKPVPTPSEQAITRQLQQMKEDNQQLQQKLAAMRPDVKQIQAVQAELSQAQKKCPG